MKGKYWYRITIHYCPPCGSEDVYRERVYGPKPKNPEDRYVYRDYYDYCLERG